MSTSQEIMEILEAFDLTRSYRSNAKVRADVVHERLAMGFVGDERNVFAAPVEPKDELVEIDGPVLLGDATVSVPEPGLEVAAGPGRRRVIEPLALASASTSLLQPRRGCVRQIAHLGAP